MPREREPVRERQRKERACAFVLVSIRPAIGLFVGPRTRYCKHKLFVLVLLHARVATFFAEKSDFILPWLLFFCIASHPLSFCLSVSLARTRQDAVSMHQGASREHISCEIIRWFAKSSSEPACLCCDSRASLTVPVPQKCSLVLHGTGA